MLNTRRNITRSLIATALASVLTNAAPAADTTQTTNASGAALPLSQVILYSSGVGYFERSGQVTGRTEVDLHFKTEDVNDLLKSLVVQDANGGHVSTVTYESRDPLTKTLRSFAVDLTGNPSQGQLLNQARGERVTIEGPATATGTILGVETRKLPVGENRQIDAEFLNLLTDDGMQSIPLAGVQKVKLLNEKLNMELQQALLLLATSHEKDKKTVGITFDGDGKRKVSVSYIAQTPVWKTSYRLVLADTGNPFLQGWAIVENTSDEDWSNVKLALVSGRPISFVMDLYEPLYATRPVVEPELFRSLHPQVYQDALEGERPMLAAVPSAAPAPVMAPGRAGRGGAGGGGFGGGGRGAVNSPVASSMQLQEARAMAVDGSMAYESMDLKQGVASMADTGAAGELFEYEIKTPVTLARQRSAMLPIVNQEAGGEKVSIYNETVQAKFPVNGFRLKNTTGLNLMQGPITVFDGGAYAGDARIEDLAPGQDRLLSYGLDLKTEVDPKAEPEGSVLDTVVIHKGTVVASRRYTDLKTYTIKNRDTKKKTVLIEHPVRAGWELVEPKEKPERARDVYRFAVPVDPGQTAKLAVREERPISETALLGNAAPNAIAEYLRARKLSTKVRDAFKHVTDLRDALDRTTAERLRREQTVSDITQEQGRIRANMQTLQDRTADLYKTYLAKLTTQENDLDQLRKQIDSLKDKETTQQKELDDYLTNLDVE